MSGVQDATMELVEKHNLLGMLLGQLQYTLTVVRRQFEADRHSSKDLKALVGARLLPSAFQFLMRLSPSAFPFLVRLSQSAFHFLIHREYLNGDTGWDVGASDHLSSRPPELACGFWPPALVQPLAF